MDLLELKRTQVRAALADRERLARQGGLLVCQVMTLNPSHIGPETSVLELVRMLHANEFRHLLVTDPDGRLLGVVSDRDIVRCFGPGRYPDQELLARTAAREIMSTDVLSIGPSALLELAVVIMVEHGVSCLPVVAGEELVGIITNTDLDITLELLLRSAWQASHEQPVAQGA